MIKHKNKNYQISEKPFSKGDFVYNIITGDIKQLSYCTDTWFAYEIAGDGHFKIKDTSHYKLLIEIIPAQTKILAAETAMLKLQAQREAKVSELNDLIFKGKSKESNI